MKSISKDLDNDINTIADAFGRDVADCLIARIGGIQVYVRKGPTDPLIEDAIGPELAGEFTALFGGCQIYIPTEFPTISAPKWKLRRDDVRRLTLDGWPAWEVAMLLKVSQTRIYQLRAKLGLNATDRNVLQSARIRQSKITTMAATGKPLSVVSEKFGTTKEAVIRHVRISERYDSAPGTSHSDNGEVLDTRPALNANKASVTA